MRHKAVTFLSFVVLTVGFVMYFSPFTWANVGNVRVVIVSGGESPLDNPDVVIRGSKATRMADGSFLLSDIPYGIHPVLIRENDTPVYSRNVQINRAKTELTVVWKKNLSLKNAGFEDPMTGRTTIPGWAGTHRLSDENVYAGNYSLRMTRGQGTSGYARSDSVPVMPGSLVELSAQTYLEEGRTPLPNLHLEFLNSDDEVIHRVGVRARPLKQEWHRISIDEIAPRGTVAARVYLYLNTSFRDAVYWDDLQLNVSYLEVSDR